MRTLPKAVLLPLVGILAAIVPQASPGKQVSIPFNAANFSDPLTIDNDYLPLVPGTTFVYEAETPDGCEVDRFAVTTETKPVDGVMTRVIHDQAFEGPSCDGPLELVEDTFDWHAQDDSGNVWYFGEDTRHCTPAGCTPGDGSWEAGVDGAQPGVVMLAHPQSGISYRQEYYPGHAEDQALVLNIDAAVKLRSDDAYSPGTFDDCIVTKEWSTLEPGSIEQKSYCPGIGNVLVEEHHGKVLRSELTEIINPFRFRTAP